jgi:hypothetical protein
MGYYCNSTRYISSKKIDMKKPTFLKVSFGVALLSIILLINGCDKDNVESEDDGVKNEVASAIPLMESQPIVKVMTVADITPSVDGATNKVVFCQNAEVFFVQDETILATLRQALAAKTLVKVTFNPWSATVAKIDAPTSKEISKERAKQIISGQGITMKVNLDVKDELDKMERIAVIDRTIPGLTNVVPDMATAQLMFDYLSKQCCAVPGPYSIDYCISFQYAEDGCYARAQKMCTILNDRYHYDTHKIFSFANAGSDVLSVKANKWGGCCVNWWYHVAPLVNIKTPSGTKAYVFDPAMFDQPVLLAAWLHAQQNPACASMPHVSMINIQPTVSYSPADYTGYAFDTDPGSVSTDYTLVNYSGLQTCP